MKEKKEMAATIGWKNLESTGKAEKVNDRKYKRARKVAVVGIPIFSITFVIFFFGIGYLYILQNN